MMTLRETIIPFDRFMPNAGGPVVYLGELADKYIIVPQAVFADEFNQMYASLYPGLGRHDAHSDWQILNNRGWANYNRVSEEQLQALRAVGELLTQPDYWVTAEQIGRTLSI